MEANKTNYLYLYDLPKDIISSVKLALAFKDEGVDIGIKRPFIKRDIFKPFYSAILNVTNVAQFDLAKTKMRYFNIEKHQCRSLAFDKDHHHHKSSKEPLNIFFKLGKDGEKSQLTYRFLLDIFEKFGEIRSCKISVNPDGSNKGYAYI
jgi:hypothetical protein